MAGLLIGYLLPEELLSQLNPQIQVAKVILMGTLGTAGVVLGAIVLSVFPRSIRSAQAIARMGESRSANMSTLPVLEDPTSRAVEVATMTNTTAPRDLGGYSRSGIEELEGRYVCFRPMFSNPEVINAYLVVIRWDERRSCLIFEEQNRPDSAHTQNGLVYLPDGKPFLSLVTMEKGSVRLIMVARPDGGLARGMIMTLSNPGGTHFIPTAAPIVLRRLGEIVPQLGFVHRNSPDYDLYLTQLRSVAPHFGTFANAHVARLIEARDPVHLSLVERASG
jgi:hypothetical protein